MRFSGLCAAVLILAGATAAVAQSRPGSARAAYRPYFEQRYPAGPRITPAEVRALIARRGATGAVQYLDRPGNRPDRWDSVLRGIALGDPAWLAVAPEIAEGTDAGTSESYVITLTDALVSNATGVLRMILAGAATVEDVCLESGIETPRRQHRLYDAAAIEAVQRVTAPSLRALKVRCLASLRADAARR